jgi:tetraacyldisaccharide 4'-kinase
MRPLRRSVESILGGKDDDSRLAESLRRVSLVYGGLLRLRSGMYRKGVLRSRRLSCRVVSVGNITAGGTGKTPMTIFLARAFLRSGCRVAVLSRGYGGNSQRTGGIVSDGTGLLMRPDAAGDEPFMMAEALPGVPVLVGGDRYRSGITALERFHPDVMVLDDGFQHLKLKRDLDLVLLDGRRPLGNGHVLPRGPLRERPSALGRADAFVLTRCDLSSPAGDAASDFLPPGVPVFRSAHVPRIGRIIRAGKPEAPDLRRNAVLSGNLLKERPVFAFSGIADNGEFLKTIQGYGARLAGHCGFSDHHRYSAADLNRIMRAVRTAGAEWVVTTEKDFVRLPDKMAWPVDLAVIRIEISFGEAENAFLRFVGRHLDIHSGIES